MIPFYIVHGDFAHLQAKETWRSLVGFIVATYLTKHVLTNFGDANLDRRSVLEASLKHSASLKSSHLMHECVSLEPYKHGIMRAIQLLHRHAEKNTSSPVFIVDANHHRTSFTIGANHRRRCQPPYDTIHRRCQPPHNTIQVVAWIYGRM